MAGAAQRVERLRRIPLFADLSLSALSEIARVAKEMDVPAGRVLIEPNQTGSGLYVIEDGVVEVEARRRRSQLGAGDFVGELALLNSSSRRTARVCAKTDVRCLAISRTDFARVLREHPRIALAMLKTLAERLEAATS